MFRNLSFRTKLALILVPPILMLLVLATSVVSPRLDQKQSAGENLLQARYAIAVMEVLDNIQTERGAAVEVASTKGVSGKDRFAEHRASTDAAIVHYRAATAKLSGADRTYFASDALTLAFDTLPQLRSDVEQLTTEVNGATRQYNDRAQLALELIIKLSGQAQDSKLLRGATAIADFSRFKESLARQNALLIAATSTQQFAIIEYGQLKAYEDTIDQSLAAFRTAAIPEQIQQLEEVRRSGDFAASAAYITVALQSGESGRALTFTAQQWTPAAEARLGAIDVVDDALFAYYSETASGLQSSASKSVVQTLAVTLAGVLVAIAGAALLANSIVRRIRALARSASSIATERLPEVLDALRHPTPELLAERLPQVQSDSTDEIGQLGVAFNTVLRTAVETSLGHAQQRTKTMTNMLVNLGRRNQSLIDRQLELIDRLESEQEDPQLLEDLFKLDHMVTRMRRNAENLLVLASEQAARQWSEPVPILDVLRSAASEVQAITRIEIDVDAANNLPVLGRYAIDLSHLVAELVENSTAFSPPSSRVSIRSERTTTGLRIWVVDSGVGMDDEDLVEGNARLASPPDIDELTADRVGFQVVGRLARRAGITVALQDNPGGGLAALVDLPTELFEVLPPPEADRVPGRAPRGERTGRNRSNERRGATPAPTSGPPVAVPAPVATPAANGTPQRGRRADAAPPAPAVMPTRKPNVAPPARIPEPIAAGNGVHAPAKTGATGAAGATGASEPTSNQPPTKKDAAPEGLVRRLPGSAFSTNATAAAVEQGKFRRLPAPNAAPTPRPVLPESDDDFEDDDEQARQRLAMLNSLRGGVGKGRETADADDLDNEGDWQ